MSDLKTAIENMVRQLKVAIKTVGMYSLNHPSAQQAIEQSFKILKLALADKEDITISVDEGVLIAEGLPLDRKSEVFDKFATDLTERRIEGITFKSDLALKEFQSFIELLLEKPEALKYKDNVGYALSVKGVTNIGLNELKYRKVSEGLEKLEDAAISNYLLGKAATIGDKEKDLLDEINENPSRIASLLSQAASGMDSSPGTSPATTKVQNTAEMIGRMGTQLLSKGTGDWRRMKKNLVEVLLNLDPVLKSDLMNAKIKGGGRTETIAKEVLDEAVVETVATKYSQKNLTSVELSEVFQNLIPDESRREELLPLLKERLSQEGVSGSKLEQIKDSVLQGEISLEERFENAMQNPVTSSSEVKTEKSLIFSLVNKGKTSEAQKMMDKFITDLDSPNKEVRQEVADGCFSMIDLASKSEELKGTDKRVCELMIQRIEKEEQIEVYTSLVGNLTTLIQTDSAEKHDIDVEKFLKVLHSHASDSSEQNNQRREIAEKARETLITPDMVERLMSDLRGDDEIKQEKATSLLINIADVIIDPLIINLTEEEDRKVRARLLKIIESVGIGAVEVLKSYLNDDRWYVVRNLVRLLGTVGDENIVETVLPFLSHENPKVRKESILSLLKIGSDRSFDSLILALNDQDSAVQTMAITALSEIGQKRSAPILDNFLKRGTPVGQIPKKSAIEALGKVGGEDTIATLATLVDKKGMFAKGETEDVREMVVEALRKIGGVKGLNSLKKIAIKDSSRNVRIKATIAIRSLEQELKK